MSLTKCKECKHEISTSAPYCPNCGAKIKRTSLFTKIVVVFFVFILISMYFSLHSQKKVKIIESEVEQEYLKWNYTESDDKMGQGKIKGAFVKSLNQVEFDFPYKGLQRATLELRIHPRYGKDVLFSIERGQFLCGVYECEVQVRFGDGKPITFSASKPADNSTTVLFINNYDRFVANMKKVDKVYIEGLFFQEGNRVFEFDVSGLNWP